MIQGLIIIWAVCCLVILASDPLCDLMPTKRDSREAHIRYLLIMAFSPIVVLFMFCWNVLSISIDCFNYLYWVCGGKENKFKIKRIF